MKVPRPDLRMQELCLHDDADTIIPFTVNYWMRNNEKDSHFLLFSKKKGLATLL